jgi:hypothetical protein
VETQNTVRARKKKQSDHATNIAFTKNTSKAAYFGYHSRTSESNLFLKKVGLIQQQLHAVTLR